MALGLIGDPGSSGAIGDVNARLGVGDREQDGVGRRDRDLDRPGLVRTYLAGPCRTGGDSAVAARTPSAQQPTAGLACPRSPGCYGSVHTALAGAARCGLLGIVALLIVEDNATLAASLTRGLTEDGYAVDAVGTGGAALRRLERQDIDAIVLDLGLPKIDGASRPRRGTAARKASR